MKPLLFGIAMTVGLLAPQFAGAQGQPADESSDVEDVDFEEVK